MKSKYWAVLISLILLLCIGASLFLLGEKGPAGIAEIRSDGTLVRTVNLNEDQEFTVPCPGGYNNVTVKDGKIAVTAADCPDGYCIARGFCNSGTPIVCLPHKLVIEFVGMQEIDGIIG